MWSDFMLYDIFSPTLHFVVQADPGGAQQNN